MDKVTEKKKLYKLAIQQRKEHEKKYREECILESARKVFYSKGYAKTTMDEIALKAKISKPTVYQYFKNKDTLFFSLVLPVLESIRESLTAVSEKLKKKKLGNGSALSKELFEMYYRIYMESPETFHIIQISQQTGLTWQLNEEVRESLYAKARENYTILRLIMSDAIEANLFRKTNPFELADVLWGQVVGIIQIEDIKSSKKPFNEYLQPTLSLAADIFYKGLVP